MSAQERLAAYCVYKIFIPDTLLLNVPASCYLQEGKGYHFVEHFLCAMDPRFFLYLQCYAMWAWQK